MRPVDGRVALAATHPSPITVDEVDCATGKDEQAPTLLQTDAGLVSAFIIGGIVFTPLLIAVLYFVVRLSLRAAGM